MTTRMIEALAGLHVSEVRGQAAQRRGGHHDRLRRPPRAGQRRARLRRRIGFTLIEAGFQLLATARPVPRD